MSQELYTKISEALTARKAWEGRQTTTYQMRRTGLRRKSKPFPGAADMHYPLADSIVEKQKPLLYNQVFNPAKLATFQSWKPDYARFVDGVERYFDYKLRRKSNFSAEMLIHTDILLETGKAILKVIWDERDNQLLFEALDPLYFIVPAACKDIRQADWVAQVHQYTVDAYKALDNFKRDEETLAAITGKCSASRLCSSR
ncbi:MAG: hypothetical protein LBK60_06410 [Verrucomicrobiales bacterium]|jgi:hypothetical protein|nr:hypothetical protein [Verrucomicrobiales bacterium]